MKNLNILIVDDHPMTIDGYINVLSEENFENAEIKFHKAIDCKEAYNAIVKNELQQEKFDVAYLDLSLPPFTEKNILSGLDLGLLIRKTHPKCIVIILTMHSESSLIDKLIKEINPEGILCKSDIDIDEFIKAFRLILGGEKYYSNKIVKSLKDKTFNNYNLDNYDKQILMRLSEGILTKNIPNYVPLSLSSIEKRKAQIKNLLLEGEEGDDQKLIETIKKLGII